MDNGDIVLAKQLRRQAQEKRAAGFPEAAHALERRAEWHEAQPAPPQPKRKPGRKCASCGDAAVPQDIQANPASMDAVLREGL